jgi:hypothetical protein
VADRVHERQPERAGGGRQGGPRCDGAHPGADPAGLVPVPARAGLPDLGEVDFVLLHGRGRGRAGAQEASDALAAAILGGGDRLHRPADGL